MIVTLLLGALVLLTVYVATQRLSGLQLAASIVVGVFGITLVIVPQFASSIAVALGVGRGTDLLLYVSIIGGLFISSNLYFRARRHEEQIVTMVRQFALLARRSEEASSGERPQT